MAPDDEERKKRAEDLRLLIRKSEKGGKPAGSPSPKEITDEAARKSRSAPAPDKQ
jgi:hypothetical protein